MMLTHRIPAAAALAAALALASCSGAPESAAASSPAAFDVTIETARLQPAVQSYEAGGVVRARTTATLVSRIVAGVDQVLVKPGDRVRAGQLLVRLDARDLQAERSRAEAGLAEAEQGVAAATTNREAALAALALAAATHGRMAGLRAKNSATPDELDQAVSGLREAESRVSGAEAGIRQARAGVEAARAGLRAAAVAASYADITAPFDGVVTEKKIEAGNMATPGAPLLVVEDTRAFRLEVRLDEARAAGLDRTRPVAVSIDSVDAGAGSAPAITATVAEVERSLDAGSHAFLVKLDLPPIATVQSGMYGRATFPGGSRQAIVIPVSATIRHGQLTSVFVVGADNRARLRLVQVGAPADGRVIVAAGLDEGESVVAQPPPAMVDGSAVHAVTRSTRAAGPDAPAAEIRR
jgi:RND family efflux transporter MFP subunit